MVVHDAYRLQMGVHDRGPDELEAALPQIFADPLRQLRAGRDLIEPLPLAHDRPAADEAPQIRVERAALRLQFEEAAGVLDRRFDLLPIPDQAGEDDSSISFGVLKTAQALGDSQALRDAGRKVIRFHLGKDIVWWSCGMFYPPIAHGVFAQCSGRKQNHAWCSRTVFYSDIAARFSSLQQFEIFRDFGSEEIYANLAAFCIRFSYLYNDNGDSEILFLNLIRPFS